MDRDRIESTRDAFHRLRAESRRLRDWSQATRHWSDQHGAVWKRLRHRFVVRADLRLHTMASFRPPNVAALESLEEIVEWLDSLRQRLERGRESDRAATQTIVQQLEAQYKRRRAELS